LDVDDIVVIRSQPFRFSNLSVHIRVQHQSVYDHDFFFGFKGPNVVCDNIAVLGKQRLCLGVRDVWLEPLHPTL
jgi:hypothetical protein